MSKTSARISETEVWDQPSYTTTSSALPSFVSPAELLWNDIKLFFSIWKTIPGIILPFRPCVSGPLDELSFTPGNLMDMTFHGFLIVMQLGFLASLPLCLIWPLSAFLLYFVGFLVFNYIVCIPINGRRGILYEVTPKPGIPVAGKGEKWIFINGVAVGWRWLHNNTQLLANTFRRPIVAVHNPTSGIIFDLIQCIIERDFSYNTRDIRQAYALIKDELTKIKDANDTVILVVHSQGAIECGMIIDWLLADIPRHNLSKLEVYTFGNAANHFNSPLCGTVDDKTPTLDGHGLKDICRVIRHIEHYANSGDFVSQFGVLYFSKKRNQQLENRFVGRVFEREGSGHMFCQHYLDTMFVMEGGKVAEDNEFMDSKARVDKMNSLDEFSQEAEGRTIKSLSRLWQYRNGRTPEKN